MKNIRSIPLAMLFAFCIIMFSLTSYSQDLKALLDDQMKSAPKFDRAVAEKRELTELGLNEVPYEVPEGKELSDLIGKEAERLAALKFTAAMEAKFQQEAKVKFKAIQQGDEITVQVRYGAGYTDYKGKYKGTAGEKVLVGEKQILKSDLQPDILDRLNAGKMAVAQGAYLSTNFTEPRKRYIAEQAEKLKKGYAEKKKAYNNFISAVDAEEKDYKSGLKEKTMESVIGKYLDRKQPDIEKLASAKDKLKAYGDLVAEIKTFLDTEGISKVLDSYASMKPVISETIPALEKKDSERLAAEKREADEKRIAEKKEQEEKEKIADDRRAAEAKEDAIAKLSMCMFHLKQVNCLIGAYDDMTSVMEKDESNSKTTDKPIEIFNIKGRICGELDVSVYEISINNKRAILKTRTTRFTSTGNFKLDCVKYSGTEEIKLKNGFTDVWDVYEEMTGQELDAAVRDVKQKEWIEKFSSHGKYLRDKKGEVEGEIKRLIAVAGDGFKQKLDGNDPYDRLDRTASQKLFPVKDGASGKYGYINSDGEIVIGLRYEEAGEFNSYGIAKVGFEGKCGFIDSQGAYFILPLFNFLVSQTPKGFFWGQEIVVHNAFIIDKNFEKCRLADFDYSPGGEFSKDSDLVGVDFRKNGKSGYVDESGTVIIPPSYVGTGRFSEGYAPVDLERNKGNYKRVYIDRANKKINDQIYELACSFSEGYASVKQDGKWFFIDRKGRDCFPIRFDFSVGFSEGMAAVEINGKDGFIDTSGKIIIAPSYDYADSFHEGLCRVTVNKKYGFIDKSGKMVISANLKGAESFKNGLAKVQDGGAWDDLRTMNISYINKQGKLIWRPSGWRD